MLSAGLINGRNVWRADLTEKYAQIIHAEVKDFHDRSKTPENATSVAELRLSRSRCGDVASDAIRPVSPV
ncbi:hypothetical protein ACUOFC_17470 [Escherichia sp. TWPC-MK]